VSSRGWSYKGVERFLDRTLPQLERIPLSADLFDSEAHDGAIGDLIDVLNGQPGILIANSCKIFYQKRPAAVPILDQYARCVFNVPWGDEDDDIVTPALRNIRRVAAYGSNPQTLANLNDWLRDNPHVTNGLSLSRLRVLDILAWGVMRQRNDAAG